MTTQNIQQFDAIKPLNVPSDPTRTEYEAGKKSMAAGDYSQAALSLHNALLAAQEQNDQPGIANASNQLGLLCLAKKDFPTASKHFEAALAICQAAGDGASVAAITRSLIESLTAEGLFPRAVASCFDLLDLYAANNDPQGGVAALETLAEVYIAAGQTARAADTLRTVASIHRNYRHQDIADQFLCRADALEQGVQS